MAGANLVGNASHIRLKERIYMAMVKEIPSRACYLANLCIMSLEEEKGRRE